MTEGSAKAMGDETRIGQMIPGKGIYLGIWSPKDREGVSLSKTFNVFAAPYDLGLDENGQGKKRLFKSKRDEKLIAPYYYTVGTVAAMKNLMGHKGADYKNDTELYDALRSGAYKGEWFIPPRDLVDGKDVDGNKVQNDDLYQHRKTGKFANTFARTANGRGGSSSYWSCTERRECESYICMVNFRDGRNFWFPNVNGDVVWSSSARVVRAELRP